MGAKGVSLGRAAPPDAITVEVVYALAEASTSRAVRLAPGTTVGDAIAQSGIERLLGLDFSGHRVGIFGRLTARSQLLSEGDRVEVYRELVIDPEGARQLRASRKKPVKA